MSVHPLENNIPERARFERMHDKMARAVWRRAIEAATSGLPTWAERKRKGPQSSFDVSGAVALYRAGGVTLAQVARQYGIQPCTLGYHARKEAPPLSSTPGAAC